MKNVLHMKSLLLPAMKWRVEFQKWKPIAALVKGADIVKYKTFATLLIQNLQKGSRHMGEMLEKESVEAWDDRKRKAKVQGEAATTKLLFPMILMLGVVMAIVMLPACLSFYG